MSKIKYCYDTLDKSEVENLCTKFPDEDNKYICETAGFIPLEVKMKQYEQNGMVAQFLASDFDSHDYRNIYLNPDFNITPEDELEDIQEKLEARSMYIEELKKLKSNELKDKAGTQEPEKKSEKKVAAPQNDE